MIRLHLLIFVSILKELILSEENIFIKEFNKTRLIKLIYSLLLIFRTYQILNGYFYFHGLSFTDEWIFSFMFVVLLFLLLFKNYWIVPLLIALFQVKFDAYFGTSTVGSTITVFVNYYFAAYYFSLKRFNDSIDKNYRQLNFKVYNYKYLLAILWSILNLYSTIGHLNDSHWVNGSAFGVMLCNAYTCPFFQNFRTISIAHPEWYLIFSKITSYTFILMQILMLPLFLISKTRHIFYIWLFLYIIGITFIIDVSFLAHFAWLLFFILLPQITIKKTNLVIQKNSLQLCETLPKLNRTFLLILLTFVVLNTPKLENIVKKPIWFFREWDTYQMVNKKLRQLGLKKVDLFNSYILDGGDRWFVIYKQEKDNWQLVPIMDTTGKKLSYNKDWLHTTNHGSDFLWLANTYQYAIGQEYVLYSTYIYVRLIRFDFNKYVSDPETKYKVCFYSNAETNRKVKTYAIKKDSTIYYSCSKTDISRTDSLNSN